MAAVSALSISSRRGRSTMRICRRRCHFSVQAHCFKMMNGSLTARRCWSRPSTKGVIGIAPRCGVRVVSQWFDQPNAKFISTASAIATAIAQMNAGDVLLVESSSIVPDLKFGLLPAEVDPVVFDLIKTATGNGITVVEPAGNNDTGSNLDALRTGAVALSLTASSLPSGTPARSKSAPQAQTCHTSDSGIPIMVVA